MDAETLDKDFPELKEADRTKDYWIIPVFLVFVGSFLGPFSSLFFTALATRFKIDPRKALFLIGLAGTTICLVQGVTVVWGAVWSHATTYAVRGLINFACGAAWYFIAREHGRSKGYFVSRRSLVFTIASAVIVVTAFFFTPPSVLFALGR